MARVANQPLNRRRNSLVLRLPLHQQAMSIQPRRKSTVIVGNKVQVFPGALRPVELQMTINRMLLGAVLRPNKADRTRTTTGLVVADASANISREGLHHTKNRTVDLLWDRRLMVANPTNVRELIISRTVEAANQAAVAAVEDETALLQHGWKTKNSRPNCKDRAEDEVQFQIYQHG